MRVIDLVNKIAKGEYSEFEWFKYKMDGQIWKTNMQTMNQKCELLVALNCEVIEEPIIEEPKKIENINIKYTEEAINNYKNANFNSNDMEHMCNSIGFMMSYINKINDKLNEIIDYINKDDKNDRNR